MGYPDPEFVWSALSNDANRAGVDPFVVTVSTDWLKPDQWQVFHEWSTATFGPTTPDEPDRPSAKERNDRRAEQKRIAKRRAKKKRANNTGGRG